MNLCACCETSPGREDEAPGGFRHGRTPVVDVSSTSDDYFDDGLRCNPRQFRFFGDAGRDRLQGSTDNDLLVGGRGRDTVNGNGGRDTCSGEKLSNCEIRLR